MVYSICVYLRLIFFYLRFDPQIPHPPVQMTPINAHALGSLGDIAVKFRKLVLDKLSLIRIRRVLE